MLIPSAHPFSYTAPFLGRFLCYSAPNCTIKVLMPFRFISPEIFAAQSSIPFHPPLPRLSFLPLPSNPGPTGINIVRTEFTSFLSQPDPLLAIPMCLSSFSFPACDGGWPTAPVFIFLASLWYSPFFWCISWCHASFSSIVVTPPR